MHLEPCQKCRPNLAEILWIGPVICVLPSPPVRLMHPKAWGQVFLNSGEQLIKVLLKQEDDIIRGRLMKISGHSVENVRTCFRDLRRAGILILGQGLPANVSMTTRASLETPWLAHLSSSSLVPPSVYKPHWWVPNPWFPGPASQTWTNPVSASTWLLCILNFVRSGECGKHLGKWDTVIWHSLNGWFLKAQERVPIK